MIPGITSVSGRLNTISQSTYHLFQYFFGPRRMEAVLCQASERLSGREGAAPFGDPSQHHDRMTNDHRRRTSCRSSSSSSSSSEDDRSHRHGQEPKRSCKSDRRQRCAERRETKAERRQEKRARKAERRAGKARGDHPEPYQIFILPV